MKHRFLKTALALVLGMTFLVGTAACSGGEGGSTTKATDKASSGQSQASSAATEVANGEKVEIEFWGWWSSEARKPHIEYMVNSFNESQDKVFVKYVDIPWGDIFTKNMAQIASGNPADVMAGNFGDIPYRASQSQLTALDEYMGDLSLDQFYDVYAKGVVGEDGKTYAIPLVADTRFIYYNKALFKEAGISEEAGNLPKTWDELQEVAFKLDQKNDDGTFSLVGYHPSFGNGGVDSWAVNANAGKLWFDPDKDDLIITNDLNKKALEYVLSYTDHYSKRVVDEYMAAFSSGMADPFCSGKLAMITQTNAYRSAIKQNAPDLEYGVMVMPEMKAGNGHWVNGGGFTLEIPFGAKHPAEAMEFIKWMTSPEMQAYWALNMGEVPSLKDISDPTLEKDMVYNASIEALKETHIGEYPNKIAGFRDILNPELDLILAGQKTIEQGLADADKTIRATYGLG